MPDKIISTKQMESFIRKNYGRMTNRELSKTMNIHIHSIRMKCYEMGLYRMRLNYWTEDQVEFLRENYKKVGDTELTEMFNEKFPRRKNWHKKHIEKKRKYLGLQRTTDEIININQRNLDQGRLNVHMNKGRSNFLTTGPSIQGEIRMYKGTHGIITSRIRIGKRWVYWPRWAYKKYIGKIPKDYVVIMKDGNPFNTIPENLEAVTRGESTRRCAAKTSINLSDKYVAFMLSYKDLDIRENIKNNPDLIQAYRQLLFLKRTIKQKKNERQKFKRKAA